MTTSDLEKQLEIAQKKLQETIRVFGFDKIDEVRSAKLTILSLERRLAAERMEEYADTIDFPVKWDTGAPMPHLLANGHRTLLFFYLEDDYSDGNRIESIALIQFHRCISTKLGDPNDEVFHGHPLNGKGLEPYTAQIVRNSQWIKELEAINKVHAQYNQDLWQSLNHYVLWFHDESFECVAKSFEVEVFQKNMDEVFAEATKRMLT